MANFEPKKLTKENINKGQRYQNGDGVDAEAINAPIEASLWVQSLAETQPFYTKDVSYTEPKVEIFYSPQGLPYFAFIFPEVITEKDLRDGSLEEIFVQNVTTPSLSLHGENYNVTFYGNPNADNDYEIYMPSENGTLATREWSEENLAPKGYRLIRDITLEEDIQEIDVNTDDSGNPLNLKEVFITFFGSFTGNIGNRSLKLAYNGGILYQMYRSHNVTQYGMDNGYLLQIKSERMNIPNRSIFVSQFSIGVVNAGADYNTIQGLTDMNSAVYSDYAERQALIRTINRIQYGQTNTTNGLMKAGSRIFIWGIDDDE